ncbi:hypothetical protein GCM10009750_08150 [Agromyces salentinus]|uniref:Uncharacterized protein n=1 Tax=Agromyces salentinus TaxID=269421 RepID=A0ABN2MHF9_9MICO
MVLREGDGDRGQECEESAHDRNDPVLGALRGGIAGGGHGDLFHVGGDTDPSYASAPADPVSTQGLTA